MDKKSVANEINNFSIYILDGIIFSEGQCSRRDLGPTGIKLILKPVDW